MTRVLDEAENNLVAETGVYGIWLLKHGTKLPKDQACVKSLMFAYDLYARPVSGNRYSAIENLYDAVDSVIAILNWEPLAKKYDEGLADLINSA